ncbi:MAG: glycosyltransferase family 39 protein [Bacteroidetes bacterium]|nr:glycosyltransferase family 39 protein [Bacteroidota bacterium]MBU2584035.1 glycosyltransferase family 39 protein [Bacteroidota bacterium]
MNPVISMSLLNIFKRRFTYLEIAIFFSVISLIIFYPYITNKFHADDFIFVSILEEKIPFNPLAGFWALDFKDIKTFDALWWADENVNGRFFRPIPSLVFTIVFSIFGRDAALPLHILSILLHALVSFTVFLLFLRLSKRYAVSLAAAFIYLICEDHSMTVGWIATSTDIMAVLFINLSLIFHVDYRESFIKKRFILSNVFLIIAFFCKETAVITPFAIMLYEFILSEPKTEQKNIFKRFYQRTISFFGIRKYWRGSFFLLIIYLAFYKLAGFGINNIMYFDPFKRTALYLSNLVIGIPTMFTGLLTVYPIGLNLFYKELIIITVVLGILLYVLLSFSLIKFWKEKVIHFCFLLFVLALLPQLSTDASERQLYFPLVPGSFLLSFLIFQIPPLKNKFLSDHPAGIKYFSSLFGYYLAFSSIILAMFLSFYYAQTYPKSFESVEDVVLDSKKYFENGNNDKIIYLNTTGPFATFYINDIIRYHLREYKDVHVLSSFNGKVWVKQITENSFALKTDSNGWLSNMFAKIVRVLPKIEVGKRYSNKLFAATIVQTTLDNEDALSVKFDFKISLNEILFIYYNGNEFKEFKFESSKMDTWQFLGDTSDIMKSMM